MNALFIRKTILFLIAGILELVLTYSSPSPDIKLQIEKIAAMSRPTIHLNLSANEIGKMEFNDFYLVGEDIEDTVITDKSKIKKIVCYLNLHPFVKSDRSETPNRSPDSFIAIYDKEGLPLKSYTVYGNFILKDNKTNQWYRSKVIDFSGLCHLIQ